MCKSHVMTQHLNEILTTNKGDACYSAIFFPLFLFSPFSRCSDHREITTYEQMANFRDPKDIVRPRISLASCLEAFAAPATVEDFFSTAINAKSTATK